MINHPLKVAITTIYLPPSLRADELLLATGKLVDCVDKIKTKFADSTIIVGGDVNKKNLDNFKSAFPELTPLVAGNTRKDEAMDEIYLLKHH